jgi:hypothetical protein
MKISAMTLFSISKPGWMNEMSWRLLRVTRWPVGIFLGIYVWERLLGFGSYAPFLFLVFLFGIPALGDAYFRAIYRGPSAASFRKERLMALALAVPLALTVLVVFGGLFLLLFFGTFLATFASPIHPENKIIFEADFMRGQPPSRLFTQREGQEKMQFVAYLYGRPNEGLYRLSSAEWSKDGQLFICNVVGEKLGPKPVLGIAHDFSTNKTLQLNWKVTQATDGKRTYTWNIPDDEMQKLITDHGGLDGQIISVRNVEQAETRLFGVLKFD